MGGKTINFSIDGTPVGSATTNSEGIASKTVSIAGINAATTGYSTEATFAAEASYAASSAAGSLTVGKATASLSLVVDDLEQTFDGSPKTVGYSISPAGLSGVSINYSQNDIAVTSPINAGSYIVQASITNNNYEAINATGTLVISKAEQVINWANPKNIVYGTALSDTQLNAEALGGATLKYSPALGTVLNAGLQSLSVTAEETDNHHAASKTVNLFVDKAKIALEFGQLEFTYDGKVKEATAVAKPSVSGVTVSGSGTDAGDYAVSASLKNDNYEAEPINDILKIAQAEAKISVVGKTVTYDGQAHGASGEALDVNGEELSGLNLGESFTNAPGGMANWTFKGGKNYQDAEGSVEITILKAKPEITLIAGKAPTYDGQAHYVESALVKGVNGTVLGNATVIYKQDANTIENPTDAGTYEVTADYAASTNYEAADQKLGTLVINKAAAIIAVEDYKGIYDGASHTASGNATGVGGVDLSKQLAFLTSYTNAPGGSTAWNFQGGTNYHDASGTAKVTIDKAKATIAIKEFSGTYDGIAHTATGTATGVIGEDLTENLSFAAGYTNVPGGTTSWSFDGGTNYHDENGTANVTIQQRSITVSANAGQQKVYGSKDPSFAFTPSEALLPGNIFTGELSREEGVNVGNYSYGLGTLSAGGNYSLSLAGENTFAITPKAITITANPDQSKVYGSPDPVYSYTPSEKLLQGNSFSGALSRTSGENVATYDYKMGTLSAGDNYTLSLAETNTFAITAKLLTPHIIAENKIYDGGTSATLSSKSVSGLVNEETAVDLVVGNVSFDSKKVGIRTATARNLTLSGTQASNYMLAEGATATDEAEIQARSLTVSATGINKVYDGTTAATVTLSDNRVEGDVLNTAYTSASFNDANKGTNKPVSVSGISVTGGADALNYALSNTETVTSANITALAVVVTPKQSYSKQYSDLDPVFEYVVSPAILSGDAFTGKLGRTTGEAPATYTITQGNLALSTNYALTFSNLNNATLTITKEDAIATYTGAVFASTSSATSNSATVTLSATIQDISAVDNSDTNPGDIRNATVSFVNRETGVVLATAPVGLVSSGDTKTGTATANVSLSTGSANSATFTIGIIVNNYYNRNSSEDNTVVTVSKPLSDFITGGGFSTLTNATGLIKPKQGTKNNFGFNVKYNKGGTNLQGNINTIVRGEDGRVYQVKGNVMTSLAVDISKTTAHPYPTAVFNGKANIQDITNPAAPIAIDGNATLQVTMTDAGEPGTSDKIGITVWNKSGGLWFSGSWNGVKTTEQLVTKGNLKVSSNSSFGSTATVTTTATSASVAQEVEVKEARFTTYPNPLTDEASVEFSVAQDEEYTLDVYDLKGALVKRLQQGEAVAGETVQAKWDARSANVGMYIIRLTTGSKVQTLRVLKR